MRLRNIFSIWGLALAAVAYCPAQQVSSPPHTLDARIQEAVGSVSRERLQANDLALVNFGTRHTLGTSLPPEKKAGVVQAQQWLTAQLQQIADTCQGCLGVTQHTFTARPAPRIPQPTKLVEVYAVQRGFGREASKRIILVCAHYDTIAMARMNDPEAPAPGANDDGSGASLVLEAARVLSQQRFPATVVYAFFSGEEQGLFGSRSFAQMAANAKWKLEAVLSNDIVGGDNTRNQHGLVRVFSEGLPAHLLPDEKQLLSVNDLERLRRLIAQGADSDSPSRQLARFISGEVTPYLPKEELPAESVQPKLIFRPDRYLRGGDHMAFNEMGFAAVRFTEFEENFAHQHQLPRTENGIEYGDLLKFVDFDYLAGVTRMNVAAVALLASAPAPPENVKLATKELSNTSTLRWTAAADGRATGYEVLYRETTSAEWEHAIPAGADFQITVPVSKDNVVFAVRAYDADGHRSLPVYPEPASW